MIKVAMLTPFFTEKLGGPYNVITEIVPFLEKKKVKTKIYTSSAYSQKGKTRIEFLQQINESFTIYRFNSYLRFREYRISLKMLPFLLKDSKNIDIIHSHAIRSFQEDMGFLTSLTKKIPFIVSPHGGISINWDYSDKIPKLINDKSIGLIKRRWLNPHFIAVIKGEIPIIKKYGINEDHIHYIPHGVNTEIFKQVDSTELRQKYNLENFDVLLYVGRIAKGKGVDKLIKILYHIIQKKRNIKLIIAGGDSGYLPIVRSLIQKYNLSKFVIFTGHVSKFNLAEYYSLADLVIYPSRQEILGLVIAEAMACGKPVIGSDILGPSEIILNGKTGYTSDFKNLIKLSELVIDLLNDRKLLTQMGKKGLERVKEEYTWEKAAESHFNLYKRILNKN
jgi:glycosyltransferase involved in cell wall biosynthesis